MEKGLLAPEKHLLKTTAGGQPWLGFGYQAGFTCGKHCFSPIPTSFELFSLRFRDA
jgi:hypothetical protein